MPRPTAARIVLTDSPSSVPPRIQPPIAQVPRPMRDTISEVSGIVPNSISYLSFPPLIAPCRSADHAAEIDRPEGGILVGEHIGLDVAEGRLGSGMDGVIK